MLRLLEFLAVIILFSTAGSLLPFVRKWKSDLLHLFVAFGAGVFLGTVFFHLLPSVRHSRDAFVYVLAGFLFVLLFEQLAARHHDTDCGHDCPHRHDVVAIAAFVGLVAHSLTVGFALGVSTLSNEKLGFILFFAIIAHKAVEAFSLSTVMRLSSFSAWRSAKLLVVYALMTPLGAVIAYLLMSHMNLASIEIPTAIAAGTFLYVATIDLLPEAFHVDGKRTRAVLSFFLGLAVMLAIAFAGA